MKWASAPVDMESERTFFITTNTYQRQPIFRYEAKAKLFLEVLYHYREQKKYLLHEYVIMPDHLHALITPAAELSLERAVQFIKGGFSYRVGKGVTVWQASFTNHRIRDSEDYDQHRNYILRNPVRARLAASASEFLYSSANAGCTLDPAPTGLKPKSLIA